MFNNIGRKMKTWAKIVAWLGIIASIIFGIIIMTDLSYIYGYDYSGGPDILMGVEVAAVGSLAAWLSSLVLYGFGELIEKTTEIAENTKKHG